MVTFAAILAAVAGCAPQAAAEKGTAPKAQEPSVSISWTPDTDCAVCHADESASLQNIACAASSESMACIDCHTDEPGLAEVHENATTEDKLPSRLKKTDIDASACESCHGSSESLAAETTDSTVLTDGNGKVVNPHAVPDSEKHADIACGSCHKMHSGDDAATTAPKACSSCHHAGVFECGTCHEVE